MAKAMKTVMMTTMMLKMKDDDDGGDADVGDRASSADAADASLAHERGEWGCLVFDGAAGSSRRNFS